MDVETRSAGAVEVITYAGRLDAAAAPDVRRQLEELIEDGRSRILFDLKEVTFVDSSGLAVFVNALQRARAQGGDVAVLNPKPQVGSILELTRLHRILNIYTDEQSAISAIAS